MKNERKPAAVSTEVAIGIALSVVVLFVAIGLFSDNLSSMITSSNIGNVFNGNGSKEHYDNLNRDYSKSQINVQIMGEQGLSQLRRIANNKAIEIIENPFSASNPDGNSIAYLALAIKALTGEPHVCVYMKNDSDKFCDEKSENPPSIGGYNYKIDVSSGSTLTISKVDATGTSVSKTVALPIDNAVSAVLSSKVVPIDADGRSTLSEDAKYSFIKDISVSLTSKVRPDVLLIRVLAAFTSNQNTAAASVAKEITDFQNLVTAVLASAKEANNACDGKSPAGMRGDYDYYGCGGYYRINDSDMTTLNQWQADLNSYFTSPSIATASKSDIAQHFMDSLNNYNSSYYPKPQSDSGLVTILENDNFHCNNKAPKDSPPYKDSAYDIFKTQLATINQTYSLNITIPTCKASGVNGTGVVATIGTVGTAVKSAVIAVGNAVVSAVNAVGNFFKSLFG